MPDYEPRESARGVSVDRAPVPSWLGALVARILFG